jgi:adenosylmethionine-8-amino-7-oxononanoate aminotransferase
VLLAPPFIIESHQIEELVHKLARSLESALVNT